jgi:ABC-2 type transport system permease protein
MNWRLIGILIAKDLSLFARKKLVAALTALALVTFIVVYFVMPSTISEDLEIGLYAPEIPPVFDLLAGEGLAIEVVDSEDALREGVTEGRYIAGIALPADILDKLNTGQKPEIDLYFTPDVPEESREAVKTLISELAYLQTGQPTTITITEEVLGPDMTGTPIPPRDRLLPLLAVLIIMMETMGLANLLSEEVERGTIQALMVTPLRVTDLFIAKGITGTGLAFVQAVLFMGIVGGIDRQPLIIILALLLGSVLVTGVSFLIAARARDFMSVMGWTVLALIILVIPGMGAIFPGIVSGWIKVIPSYYLVDTVHRVANFGSSWGDVWANLLILLAFSLAIGGVGILVLRRKLR